MPDRIARPEGMAPQGMLFRREFIRELARFLLDISGLPQYNPPAFAG